MREVREASMGIEADLWTTAPSAPCRGTRRSALSEAAPSRGLFAPSGDAGLFVALRPSLLVRLTALADALEDLLAVLVALQLGDDHLGRGDAEGHGLAVGLFAGDALDLDEVLETVDGRDLALTALVGATDNGDLVILADGDGSDLEGTLEQARSNRSQKRILCVSYIVLLSELLGEGSAHDRATLGRAGTEVGFARLAPRGGEAWWLVRRLTSRLDFLDVP